MNNTTTQTDTLTKVKQILENYLIDKKLRKTPERFALLEAIYTRDDHFDAETLYVEMKVKNYKVSRATVYNTLDILQECKLVIKHQFGSKLARYEKSFGYQQHDHLICVECNKILEFCDPRIRNIQSMVEDIYGFKIDSHSLNFYGTCSEECAEKQRRKER